MGRLIDLTGKTFERLTVIGRADNLNGQTAWICQCSCEDRTIKIVRGSDLKKGTVRSCGCLHNELSRKKMLALKDVAKTDGHGMTHTKLYRVWKGMRERCNYTQHKSYKYYGERGIKVCEHWNNEFMSFYKWAIDTGYQDGLTLDRIDNNGNYEPTNCRWVTRKEQSINKRNNKWIEIDGVRKTLTDWCRYYNISPSTVWARINKGWNYLDALTVHTKAIK